MLKYKTSISRVSKTLMHFNRNKGDSWSFSKNEITSELLVFSII